MPDPFATLSTPDVIHRVREIRDRQLAARGALGAMVYPLVFAIIAFGTGLQNHQASLVWSILLFLLLLASGRIAICASFDLSYPKSPWAWRTGFISSTAGLGLTWGLIAAYFMIVAPWSAPTLLLLFSGSGLASGMIATISIDRTAYRIYLLGLLVPPGLASVLSEQQHGGILGAFHLLYFLFLWVQGKKMSTAFAAWALSTVETVIQRDQLAAAKKSAEEASMAKTRLLANVSHELRTPLNAIVGTTEWALSREGMESEKPLWEEIENAGVQLLTVINQVLDFSKIESGVISEPQQEPFVPNQVLSQVHQLFKRKATQQGLELRVRSDTPDELALLGDAGRIRQILCNLIGNAFKFTSDGWIEVRAHWRDGIFSFEVTDTGHGISPEYHQLILNRLLRLTVGRRENTGEQGWA